MNEFNKSEFTGKVALITGGASGIGQTTSLSFAQKGASVIVSDVDEKGGNETVSRIREVKGEAIFVGADVSRKEEVAALITAAVDAYGKLDIAVNNAGIQGAFARTADYPECDWQRVMEVNLNGVWYCMKYELAQMLKQGGGVIVNVASVAGLVGFPSHSAYVASKHAVVGLTKTAALEYIRKGIRINAVCPGFTETPMLDQVKQERPAFVQRLIDQIPARRMGTQEEVAAAILYLCSEGAGFVTGHSLVLDGGITAV